MRRNHVARRGINARIEGVAHCFGLGVLILSAVTLMAQEPSDPWERMLRRDRDKNGKISREEFPGQAGRLQEVYDQYKNRADFFWVYVREAHPSDGFRPARHVGIAQPKTFERRKEVALTCCHDLKLTIPSLVDDMEDTVAKAYHALPDRLFILGADGKIAYRGDRGPRGFNVEEMERALGSILGQGPRR